MAALRKVESAADTTIRETAGVMGGYPCVGTTRIPVRVVVEAARTYGSDGVYTYLPQLSRAQVDAALAYYRTDPARVDEDIRTNDAAWDALHARPRPIPR